MIFQQKTSKSNESGGAVVPIFPSDTLEGFRNTLESLIADPGPVPFHQLTLDPDRAKIVLEYYPDPSSGYRQRPKKPKVITRYACQMTVGEWRDTLIPIIFTASGFLGDGQHRLNAIIESGTTITCWVGFGDDDLNFFVYDTGSIRTNNDIFSIKGVPNASLVSAAVHWVNAYECRQISVGKSPTGATSTRERAYKFYLEHADLQASTHAGHLFGHKRLSSPSIMTALHYLAAKKSRAQADVFFKKVATGVGFESQRDPAYKLREKLLDKNNGPATRADLVKHVVQAWNASRTNKPVGRWSRGSDNSFPRFI